MAGSDKTRDAVLGGPVIVLVRPQLGDNIGMVARAMLNFGLRELRVVAPRDGWPNPAAIAAAAGAHDLLEAAQLYDTTGEALGDLTRVYGTAFATKKQLAHHVDLLEEAKKRDHRVLGKQLQLFHIDDAVGQGLIL